MWKICRKLITSPFGPKLEGNASEVENGEDAFNSFVKGDVLKVDGVLPAVVATFHDAADDEVYNVVVNFARGTADLGGWGVHQEPADLHMS